MQYLDEEFLGPIPADNDHDGWARRTRRAYELDWEDRSVLGQRYRAAKAAHHAETQRSLAAGLDRARREPAVQAARPERARFVDDGPATAPWLPPQGDQRFAEWVAYHHGVAYRAFVRRNTGWVDVMAWLSAWYERTTGSLHELFVRGWSGMSWGPATASQEPHCVYEVDGIQVAWGDTPEQAAVMFRWFQQGGHLGEEGR